MSPYHIVVTVVTHNASSTGSYLLFPIDKMDSITKIQAYEISNSHLSMFNIIQIYVILIILV